MLFAQCMSPALALTGTAGTSALQLLFEDNRTFGSFRKIAGLGFKLNQRPE
jgi:hypothetical protein